MGRGCCWPYLGKEGMLQAGAVGTARSEPWHGGAGHCWPLLAPSLHMDLSRLLRPLLLLRGFCLP